MGQTGAYVHKTYTGQYARALDENKERETKRKMKLGKNSSHLQNNPKFVWIPNVTVNVNFLAVQTVENFYTLLALKFKNGFKCVR